MLITNILAFAVLLPYAEQVAPGVWAAGFDDKHGSSACGFYIESGHAVMIDPPKGIDESALREEARKLLGKPVDAKPRLTGDGHLLVNGVLFAGRWVVNGPHVNLAGYDTAAWIEKLKELEKLGPKTVVPGRGAWGGPELIHRQRRFLEEIRRQVSYAITMGRPLDAIQKELTLPAAYYTWMPYDLPVKEDIAHVYSELTAPLKFSAARPRALILIGDRFHEPEHLEAGLRPALATTGVNATFTVNTAALTAENLAQVDLLVVLRDGMLWPGGPDKPYKIWMTPAQEKAVVDFVEGGKAFLNLHNSMGLYPEGGPYLKLVGGRYIGHGPLERFSVEVINKNHPITEGLQNWWAADEQHTPPLDNSSATLLLRNRSFDGKTVANAGWAYEPGKGRLCHLASGHTREALGHPMYQRALRNAIEWCLRKR